MKQYFLSNRAGQLWRISSPSFFSKSILTPLKSVFFVTLFFLNLLSFLIRESFYKSHIFFLSLYMLRILFCRQNKGILYHLNDKNVLTLHLSLRTTGKLEIYVLSYSYP